MELMDKVYDLWGTEIIDVETDPYEDTELVALQPEYEIMGAEYDTGFGNVFTPATVKAEMNLLKSDMDIMNIDIKNSKAPPDFKSKWDDFYKAYLQFYADNQGWVSRAMNKTFALVQEYQRKMYAWGRKYQTLVGKTSFPVPRPRPATNVGFPWNKALVGLGLIAGIFLLSRF